MRPLPRPRSPALMVLLWLIQPPAVSLAGPLLLYSLEAQVRVQERIASTTLIITLDNPTTRDREAVLFLDLPEGAAVSRLALEVGGELVEGWLMAREGGERDYGNIVRGQGHTAVMVKVGAQSHRVRVYPLHPRSRRRLVLSYQELLPLDGQRARYQLPFPRLAGEALSSLATLSLHLEARDAHLLRPPYPDLEAERRGLETLVTLRREQYTPDGPLALDFLVLEGDEVAVRYVGDGPGHLYLGQFQPRLPWGSDPLGGLVLAMDTSQSMTIPALEQARTLAMGLLERIGPSTRAAIVHGGATMSVCPGDGGEACLDALVPRGGTDLEALLDAALEAAEELPRPRAVVLISDGCASLGEVDVQRWLARVLGRISGQGPVVHTVALGPQACTAGLADLARWTGGHHARLAPEESLDHALGEMAERLEQALLTQVRARLIDGGEDEAPLLLPLNLSPGQAITLAGRLASPMARLRLEGRYLGRDIQWEVSLGPVEGWEKETLTRLWAASFLRAGWAMGATRREMEEVSLAAGVLGPHTAWLVPSDPAEGRAPPRRGGRVMLTSLDPVPGRSDYLNAHEPGPVLSPEREPGRKLIAKGPSRSSLKEKERRLDELTLAERGELLYGYLEGGHTNDARALMRRMKESLTGEPPLDVLRHIFLSYGVVRLFAKEFEAWTLVQLQEGPLPWEVASLLVELYIRHGRWQDMAHLLDQRPMDAGEARACVARLVDRGLAGQAMRLVQSLLEREMITASQAYDIVAAPPYFKDRLPSLVQKITSRLVEEGDRRPEVLRDYLSSGLALGKSGMVGRAWKLCREGQADLSVCLAWLKRRQGTWGGEMEETGRVLLERLRQGRAVRLDPERLVQEAHLLWYGLRAKEEAQVVLSEMMEDRPLDGERRLRYGEELMKLGLTRKACEQFGLAARERGWRDRSLWTIGRMLEQQVRASVVNRCLGSALAGLPLGGDMALVLTWDTGDARGAALDLTVKEPGGVVDLDHTGGGEMQGGHGYALYWIRGGEAGEYKVTVSCQVGLTRPVSGLFTLIRNLGSAKEARQDVSFTMPRNRPGKDLTIASFLLP